jgi:intraflagellar transport protein 81
MLWSLQRIPELRKRAYLARFLLSLEVPPDLFNEDGID